MLTKEEVLEMEYKKWVKQSGLGSIYPTNFIAAYKEPVLSAMQEYYNQKDWQQHIMERAEWLDIEENRKSVLSYEFSPEVVSYIKQTHAFVSPCFYLLPSGEWAKIVAKTN